MELKLLPSQGTFPSLPPSETCFSCRGCCVFQSPDSPWIPYFSKEEISQAVSAGLSPAAFSHPSGSRIIPVSYGDSVCCPALDTKTHACTIYSVRPLDCFIYPFILMWNAERKIILALHEACPFVFLQTTPLPDELTRRAAELTLALQTPQMIETLSANPGMIMTTQPDTIPIATLDRLSYALSQITH